MSRGLWTLGLMTAAVLAAAGCSRQPGETLPTGLRYIDHRIGGGEVAVSGARLEMHYTGWLFEDGKRGPKFDSSLDRGQPFAFTLGAGMVIRGWDEGIQGMREGGKRELFIPSEMGYGARGAGPIPPNATLDFEVELLRVIK
jgi:FKBP-type peptidyl-prolyl cis-trans isomerase